MNYNNNFNSNFNSNLTEYVYNKKEFLMSKAEQQYYYAINESLPEGYLLFPQINLASIIDKVDNSKFRNELFRNVDFLITDKGFKPQIIIELNDQSHFQYKRNERDKKVREICEEAGIPIITLWNNRNINKDYIKNEIEATIKQLPVDRIKHTYSKDTFNEFPNYYPKSDYRNNYKNNYNYRLMNRRKKGCYVATCVYGSYDCPEVWVLRRYRDSVLEKHFLGRIFIGLYYFVSPTIVKIFGKQVWFNSLFKAILDEKVSKLKESGISDQSYKD